MRDDWCEGYFFLRNVRLRNSDPCTRHDVIFEIESSALHLCIHHERPEYAQRKQTLYEIISTILMSEQCSYRAINNTRSYQDTMVRLPNIRIASHETSKERVSSQRRQMRLSQSHATEPKPENRTFQIAIMRTQTPAESLPGWLQPAHRLLLAQLSGFGKPVLR
jgi:hypothetical protein